MKFFYREKLEFDIVACREPLLGYGKVNTSALTVTAHATEEHVTSAVTSHNNRRAAGSSVLYAIRTTAT
jgi:hypothetical protein